MEKEKASQNEMFAKSNIAAFIKPFRPYFSFLYKNQKSLFNNSYFYNWDGNLSENNKVLKSQLDQELLNLKLLDKCEE